MTLSVDQSSERGLLAVLRGAARMLLRIPRGRAILPALLWAGGIWYLSSLKGLDSREVDVPLAFLGNMAHAFEFGILALLLVLLLPRSETWVRLTPRSVGLVAFVAIFYGLVDEMHQASVVGRDASLLDWVTDALGVFCVLKIVTYVSDHEATSSGLLVRLLYGTLLCSVSAGFATLYSYLYVEGPWL